LNDEQHKTQFRIEGTEPRPRRHLAAFAASIAAHVAILGLIVYFASPLARMHREWVLAYLVEGTDGASGQVGAGAAASPAAANRAVTAIHVNADRQKPIDGVRAARKRPSRSEQPSSELASRAPARAVVTAPADDSPRPDGSQSGEGAIGGDSASHSAGRGNGAGSSDGKYGGGGDGGDQNSIAHADYAKNPAPAYPAVARRHEQQGTVTVRVLVGADGSVERAEVAQSSGFDLLDDAALETVRARWRFVPAREGGQAIESWVLVPIRFALTEANAAR
jgi:TonB family protein